MSNLRRSLYVGLLIVLAIVFYQVLNWFLDGVLLYFGVPLSTEGTGLLDIALRAGILLLDIIAIGGLFLWLWRR